MLYKGYVAWKVKIMYYYSNIKKIILLAIFLLLCLSTSSLSAQDTDRTDNEKPDKPPSFAASRQMEESGDSIMDDFIEEHERHILVSLADQKMWVFEDDTIIQHFPVSTGVPGHRTPTGNYRVFNQSLRAYSNKYDAWMLHWMAITGDGLYGMHSLQGNSYLKHLGSVASHGCIRLSHEDAQWLYTWVDIGTSVEIVDDWSEPPEDKENAFRVGQHHCVF